MELYERLLLKPVKQNNRVTEIEYEKIVKNHNKFYGIVNDCRTINFLSICNHKNILEISNSSCLPNLLRSRPSKCHQTNSQHIPMIEEITDGLVLLNQFDGDVNINNETQKMNGTYLIKFNNATISIEDRTFISKERSTVKVLPAILQPTPEEDEFKEILSLQMMKEIHVNNTDKIELIHHQTSIQQFTSYGLISTGIIIIIVIILVKQKQKRTTKIIATISNEKAIEIESQNPSSNIECNPKHLTEEKRQTPASPHQKRKFYGAPFF